MSHFYEWHMATKDAVPSIKNLVGSAITIMRDAIPHGRLVEEIEDGDLLVEHHLQRNLDAWGDRNTSEFLATILRDDPSTTIVIADDPHNNKRRLIIDGAHRADAISKFIRGEYKIKRAPDVEEALVGLGFDDLDRTLKRRMQYNQLEVNWVRSPTEDDVKRIFTGLNSGRELNAWEKLHAFPDETNQYLRKVLEKHPFWRKSAIQQDRCVPYKMATRTVLFLMAGGAGDVSPAATRKNLLEVDLADVKAKIDHAKKLLDFMAATFPDGLPAGGKNASNLSNLTDLLAILALLQGQGNQLEGNEESVRAWYLSFLTRKNREATFKDYVLRTRDGPNKAKNIEDRSTTLLHDLRESDWWPADWHWGTWNKQS